MTGAGQDLAERKGSSMAAGERLPGVKGHLGKLE